MKTFLLLITHEILFFSPNQQKKICEKSHIIHDVHISSNLHATHTLHSTSRGWFYKCNNDFNFCCSKAEKMKPVELHDGLNPKFGFKLKIYVRYLSIWPLNPTQFVWKSTEWWYHCPFRIIFISFLLRIPTIYLNCRLSIALLARCARSIWSWQEREIMLPKGKIKLREHKYRLMSLSS